MNAGRKHAKREIIRHRHDHSLVIAHDIHVEKLEYPVLGGIDGRNIPRKPRQRGAQFAARFAKNPPVVAIGRAPIFVSFGFHLAMQMLPDFWKATAHVWLCQTEKVDDILARHLLQRATGQIHAIAIGPDIRLQPVAFTKSQHFCIGPRDRKAFAMQFDAIVADARVGLQLSGAGRIGTYGQIGIDPPARCRCHNVRRIAVQPGFAHHFDQRAILHPGGSNGHGDAHGGAVLARLGPGVIGDGHDERQAPLSRRRERG